MKNNAVRPPFGGKVAYRTFTLVLLFLFLCTTIFIQTPLDVQALEPAGQLVTLSSLPEGVYAIRTMNTTDGGKYMTVQGSDPTLGGWAVCQSDESDPCANQTRSELFKISKVEGTTDCYIIRSMLNNGLALCATGYEVGGGVKFSEVSPVDSEVYAERDSNLAVWRISQAVTVGHTFCLVTSNTTQSLYIQQFTIEDSDNKGLKLVSDYNLANYSWSMFQYTGAVMSGTGTYAQSTDIAIGERIHLGIYYYDSRIGYNGLIYYINGDGAVSTTSRFASIDNMGNLTASSTGSFSVIYRKPDDTLLIGPTITVRPFPDNAIYYAYNIRSGDTSLTNSMYLQPETTQETVTACYTKTGSIGHYEWRLIARENGYYQIYNKDAGKYLEAPENVSYGYCFTLTEQSSPTNDRQLWAVVRQLDGRYLIQSKNAVGTDYYLAMAEGSDGMSWMYFRTKESAGDRAYWYIEMDGPSYSSAFGDSVTMPVVGDALVYDANLSTSKWNQFEARLLAQNGRLYDVYTYDITNCYAYALDYTGEYVHRVGYDANGEPVFPALQPGECSGNRCLAPDIDSIGVKLITMVERDAAYWGASIRTVGKYEPLESDEYRVCLVIDCTYPGKDYHWYRQNADGTWSHKPGRTSVRKVDSSGQIIYDPEFADRGTGTTLHYTVFVQWFAVKSMDLSGID